MKKNKYLEEENIFKQLQAPLRDPNLSNKTQILKRKKSKKYLNLKLQKSKKKTDLNYKIIKQLSQSLQMKTGDSSNLETPLNCSQRKVC